MARDIDQWLDRIRIDRTRDPGSINPVNPVYINSVEQIHAVDRIAVGDSNQPRSALGFRRRWVAQDPLKMTRAAIDDRHKTRGRKALSPSNFGWPIPPTFF